MRHIKTNYKIAVFLIAANCLLLGLFGASVYFFLHKYSYADFYKRLETRARLTAKSIVKKNDGNAGSIGLLKDQYLEKLTHQQEMIFAMDEAGVRQRMVQQVPHLANFIDELMQAGKGNLQIDQTFYSGIKHVEDGKTYLVILSAENYYATHHLSLLRNIIIAGIFFILFITASLSLYFARHIFDPIRRITNKVKEISTENIHLRLPESDGDSEISQLILTFNNLLNRLETSFETQKNFISNASHEFGTPLTSIIGEADLTLKKERTPAEYQETLQHILAEAERLNQISQSLLFLAQTGYKENKLNVEILRTDELLWQSKEIINKLFPKNNIEIDISLLPENPRKLKVLGNKQLLMLAFVNILSNACKYAANKPVSVSIASSDEQVILLFKDQGIGIPEAELKSIFDPFFRASNTHNFDGYGIGLPLTRNIVKIHNGHLQVSSVLNEGTAVQVRLPIAVLPAK